MTLVSTALIFSFVFTSAAVQAESRPAMFMRMITAIGETIFAPNESAPVEVLAASTLSAGDVAITGYSADPDTVEGLSFVFLRAVGSGTQVFFTDRAWNGSTFAGASAGEGTLTYTAGTDLPAGTVVLLNDAQLNAGGIELSTAGETIYAYQGTNANTPTAFLFAADVADGNTTFTGSLAGTGLSNTVNAVAVRFDNAAYHGPTTDAYAHLYNGKNLLQNIADFTNWNGDDDPGVNVAIDQADQSGPYNVASDIGMWLGGSGAGGGGVFSAHVDNTVSGGAAGYNMVVRYFHDTGDINAGQPTNAFVSVRDIQFDMAEGKFFVLDGSGGVSANNKVLQGNIADLIGNPATPPTVTVLTTSTGVGIGENIFRDFQIDTVNNIIYLTHGQRFEKLVYNTPNQTPVVLAQLGGAGSNNPNGSTSSGFADDFVINYATGNVYFTVHRVIAGQDGDQVTRNFLYRISGLDPGDGAGAFTWGAPNNNITTMPFNLDDDDVLVGDGSFDIVGEAFPRERGTLEGLALSADGNTLYFATASILFDHDNDGGVAGGPGTAPQLKMGGVYSYALTANAAGNYTQIWQQLDDGDNVQTIDPAFGPQGLLDDVEIDPVTGQLYFLDLTGDQLSPSSNPPGDEGVWRINTDGSGGLVFVQGFYHPNNTDNPIGAGSLFLNRAPTVTSSTQATPTVTEASNGPSSGATALVQPFTAADVTDIENAGNSTQQLAGATVWISNNFQSGATHQDTLTINGSTSGTINGIPFNYNGATGAMTLTGIDTFNDYEAAITLVRFNTSGDNITNFGYAPNRTISWAVSDGLNHSDQVNTTVTVVGINDAPVNTIQGSALGITEDAANAVLSTNGNAISVFDVDADPASQDVRVTLSVANGALTILTNIAGGIVAGDITAGANGTNTITITATQNQINATLTASNALLYTPILDFYGSDTLTVVTNDLGFNGNDPGLTGTASSEQDSDTRTINVAAVADITADSLSTKMGVAVTANLITGSNPTPDSFENPGRAITSVTQGSNGGVTFAAGGDVTYTPNPGFFGTDTFTYTVTSGGVTETATVSVTVISPPTISKAFASDFVVTGGTVDLVFTLVNPNLSTNLTQVAFTDTLPTGLLVATPNGLSGTCGAGTVTAVSGSNSISLTGGTMTSNSNCVITVKVTADMTEGLRTNISGAVSSLEGGTGGTATDTITVVIPPSFTKSFGATTLAVGDATTLTFNITNNSTTTSLTGVSFTDTLPAGLVVGTPNNLTGTCGGGTITATDGSGAVGLAGATLAASANCTFTVDVKGTTAGMKNNTVDLVTTQTGTGPTATDSLDVFVKPNVFVRDAKVSEPSTGSANMVFAVTLSQATSATVSVDFTTAPDTGGANPATAGTDYTTTSGSVTFMPGQLVKTISVPVLSDGAVPAETDETFLVDLSNATNGDISDGQAVGTITQGNTPGEVLISELRTSGPGGTADEYVEIYNNSASPITVAASDASAGWSVVVSNNGCTDDPVIVGIIPNGTIIPARGHYLFVGSQYSLANYGGTGAAAGNLTMTEDLDADANVALFSTSDLKELSSVNRYDAVGFGLNTQEICDLLRERTTLNGVAGSTDPYAFVRKYADGAPQDTNANASDFHFVSTTGVMIGGVQPLLGAPGPQNLTSPLESLGCEGGAAILDRSLLDTAVGVADAPNLVRDPTPAFLSNAPLGTLEFRRTFTNNTGTPITRLRFRLTDISSLPAAPGTADLRAILSTDMTVMTSGGNVSVKGTTLEAPPAQPNAGAVNSSMTVTLGTPIGDGSSVNLAFRFGVHQTGNYNIAILTEQLPGGGQERWTLAGDTEAANSHTDTACNEPPETTIDTNPSDPSTSSSASFDFSGTDADGTVASFECKLDAGAFAACTSPQSYTSLAEGSHTFQVRAIDDLGAEDPTPASFTWTIDTLAPDTTITANPPDPSMANVSFSFTGNDGSGTGVTSFECKLDAGAFAACTSPQPYNGLTDGSHTFQVKAIDGAGIADATPAAYTWTVDGTAPDTTITAQPNDPSNSASASFSFNGTDGGSGVASFECKLDTGLFAACTSPQSYNSLTDGSHTFEVRAVDGAGNSDASPASFTWVVDTTAPDTTITAHPTDPSNSSSPSFSFTGNDGSASGVASFECQMDGGGYAACTSPQAYTGLADGSHTFHVRAIDGAGNVDATPASYTWTIDTAPPDTSITANPPNPTNSTSASFSFTGTDSGTGVASFECKLDAGAFVPCTSPQNYAGLSDGSHTFQVKAIDGIGNVDPTPASYTWTVDTDPPDVTINQAAGQPDPANGMGITIHFTAVFNEPVTGFTSSDVTVGGTAGATTVVVTQIAPMNGTTYNVAVSGMTTGGTVTASIGANKATDAAGNGNTASTSTDNTVTYVPNTPPTANPDAYSTTQDTPLTVAAPGVLSNDSDPDAGNTITAVLVSGPTNAASFTLNADGSFSYTPTAGFTGTDTFTYKARDNFNADSNTVTVTLSVKFKFGWVSNSGSGYFGTFTEQGLNQVTAGSDVPVRFTLYGNKGNPYSSPPTSQQINCSTQAPIGAATVINRYMPDPFYSSLYDYYQTTWRTQTAWKFTCRRLTLHLNDGTTRSLNFYFK